MGGLWSCEGLDLTSVIPSETLSSGDLDWDGRVGMLFRFYGPSRDYGGDNYATSSSSLRAFAWAGSSLFWLLG